MVHAWNVVIYKEALNDQIQGYLSPILLRMQVRELLPGAGLVNTADSHC